MRVLIAYASRHGATQGIAERIAGTLTAAGLDAEIRPLKDVGDPAGYDAFVIGSAVYMFHWLKEMPRFLRRNQKLLSEQPVWLFSSGPLGTRDDRCQGTRPFGRGVGGPKRPSRSRHPSARATSGCSSVRTRRRQAGRPCGALRGSHARRTRRDA